MSNNELVPFVVRGVEDSPMYAALGFTKKTEGLPYETQVEGTVWSAAKPYSICGLQGALVVVTAESEGIALRRLKEITEERFELLSPDTLIRMLDGNVQ